MSEASAAVMHPPWVSASKQIRATASRLRSRSRLPSRRFAASSSASRVTISGTMRVLGMVFPCRDETSSFATLTHVVWPCRRCVVAG